MKTTTYTIPNDIISEIDNIPSTIPGGSIRWTEEIDQILLKYWKVKNREEFSAWFNKKYGFGSPSTLRRRYNKITSKL